MTLLLKNHLNEFVPGHDYTVVGLDAALVTSIARRARQCLAGQSADGSLAECRYWDASSRCIAAPDPETEEIIADAIETGDGWSIVEDNVLGLPQYGDADCVRMVISLAGGLSVGWSFRIGSEPVRTADVPLVELGRQLGSPLGDPLGELP